MSLGEEGPRDGREWGGAIPGPNKRFVGPGDVSMGAEETRGARCLGSLLSTPSLAR